MSPWWDAGEEARAALARPDVEESRKGVEEFWYGEINAWGDVAGLLDGGHVYPHWIAAWYRRLPELKNLAREIELNRFVHADGFSRRRMTEGDSAALLARLQAVRESAKTRPTAPLTPQEINMIARQKHWQGVDPRAARAMIVATREARAMGKSENEVFDAAAKAGQEAIGIFFDEPPPATPLIPADQARRHGSS